MKRVVKQLLVLGLALGSLHSSMIVTMEREKYDLSINIYKDPLTILYDSSYGSSCLYIPEEDLIGSSGEPIDLKILFDANDICAVSNFSQMPWSANAWPMAYKNFKDAQYEVLNLAKTFYTLDELLKLLSTAKAVAKSFLPVGKSFSNFIRNKNDYIKKTGLNRLFTYAKLQQVIAEKNLTHIRLPLKFLFIKDETTGNYVSTEQAQQVIDDIVKICVDYDTSFEIKAVSDRYALEIFAKKEKSEGKGFSKATFDELVILCKEAPFDIGDDNIFWDSNGDAVIIDTERKFESVRDCAKLRRYPVDKSLSGEEQKKEYESKLSERLENYQGYKEEDKDLSESINKLFHEKGNYKWPWWGLIGTRITDKGKENVNKIIKRYGKEKTAEAIESIGSHLEEHRESMALSGPYIKAIKERFLEFVE